MTKKQIQAKRELAQLTAEYIPKDYTPPISYLVDEEDPKNDRFFLTVEAIKRAVGGLERVMKPKHVQMVKLGIQGASYTETANQVGSTPSTVSKVLSSPRGLELRKLYEQRKALLAGPSAELRMNVLWRIVQRTEVDKPQVAIQAIKELNVMNPTAAQQPQGSQGNQVMVVINQNLLPPGPLDR